MIMMMRRMEMEQTTRMKKGKMRNQRFVNVFFIPLCSINGLMALRCLIRTYFW